MFPSRPPVLLGLALLAVTSIQAVVSTSNPTVACGAGTYSENGNQAVCHYCAPGTWNGQNGSPPSGGCTPAQYGNKACGPQFVNGVGCYGATSQVPCGAGKYQSQQGQTTCLVCPKGAHCQNDQTKDPQKCVPGTYMPNTGSTESSCYGCQQGTFNNVYGASACCKCCAGTYNDQTHQTHCFDCWEHTNPHRSYSNPGSTSSDQCQTNPIPGVTNAPSCKDTATDTGNQNGQDFCPPEQGGQPPNGTPISRKRGHTKCARGYKRCPIFSGLGGFDCVDITDPESCGGCVGPDGEGEGKDCTAIPNVNITDCQKRKCVVESCRKGYMKSVDGSSCVKSKVLHVQSPKRRRYVSHLSHSEV